jgi:amidohydrolase
MTTAHAQLKQAATLLGPQLIELRRAFHRAPELSGQEARTAAALERYLTNLGLPVQTRVAGHGLTALLEGERPGKTALVRADMDALPVTEQTGAEFASRTPGVMHACGHDAHMAMALGVATLLTQRRHELAGRVKFVFQPEEEVPPGGALKLIEAGVLASPAVDGAFALHVYPQLPVGKVAVRDGVLFSQADDFDLEVSGAGGHGALPQQGSDAVAAACEIVSALQVVRSRRIDPVEPSVISVGRIEGGTQRNVLAARVRIEGTARAAAPGTAAAYPALIESVATRVAEAFGVEVTLSYFPGFPPLVNDARINHHIRSAAATLWGDGAAQIFPAPLLAGEDFAYFTRAVPGALFLLGVGNPACDAVFPLHHPRFSIDEQALVFGAATMAEAVRSFCADPH